MDFNVEIGHEGDIRILQLTDMQVIDSGKQRYEGRLREDERIKWLPETKEENLYKYMRELVERTSPDIIVITGDITYGSFDDDGGSLKEFIEVMDSFEIPWAPVYGNHDNESEKGVEWQNEQFINSKYALFAKGSVSGNGNYTVGITQNGVLQRVLFMLDTHGCGGTQKGLYPDQLEWVEKHAKEFDAPAFMCYHITNKDFIDALIAAGYQEEYDTREDFSRYDLGGGIDGTAVQSNIGKKNEWLPDELPSTLSLMKRCGIDGVFAGHYHKINTSIMYEGIRFTLGLKTGLYDYHDRDAMGGTLITLHGKEFEVRHIYC